MAPAKPAPHGQKRQADDDLRGEQRLAKRFNLLNLEQNGKLYVPVEAPLPTPPATSYSPSDNMLVDDTRDRVYIHDLEAEIRDVGEEEEKLVFLPDIEKKIGKIPQSLLTGVHPSVQGKQMVLYSVPESLSVPRERDSVRKAIIESRERAREEQAKKAEEARIPQMLNGGTPVVEPDDATNDVSNAGRTDEDSDPMDIG